MKQKITDLNKNISRLLGAGIYLTVFFYVLGIILVLINNGKVVHEESLITDTSSFFNLLFTFKAEPFFFLGTVTLIITPIARVFFSIFLFHREGDKKFVFISAIVAAVLTLSIILGVAFSLNLG
jgi:uncharacterized membrane protein